MFHNGGPLATLCHILVLKSYIIKQTPEVKLFHQPIQLHYSICAVDLFCK